MKVCVYIAETHRSPHQLPLKLIQVSNSDWNIIFLSSILGAPLRQLLFQIPLLPLFPDQISQPSDLLFSGPVSLGTR